MVTNNEVIELPGTVVNGPIKFHPNGVPNVIGCVDESATRVPVKIEMTNQHDESFYIVFVVVFRVS